jgi:hypothetical protein
MAVFISNGDCLGNQLSESKWHSYPVINCRECLIDGPTAIDIDLQFHLREVYLSKYNDEVSYTEKVIDEFSKIKQYQKSEAIFLWFEYDLFCQTNYWFCTYLFSSWGYHNLYFVPPFGSDLQPEINFGKHTNNDLEGAYNRAIKLDIKDIEYAKDLWIAYLNNDLPTMMDLQKNKPLTFKNIDLAMELQIERMIDPLAVHNKVEALLTNEEDAFHKMWIKFQNIYPMYGFGDIQLYDFYTDVINHKKNHQ